MTGDLEDLLKPTATFEDVRVYQVMGKAVLVFIPDQGCGRHAVGKVWLPRKAIDRESEVPREPKGYLIVERWYAEREGWVG